MVRVTNLILNSLGDSSTNITGYSSANDATVAFASGGGVRVTAQAEGPGDSGVSFRSAFGSLVVGQEYTISLDVVGEVADSWKISVQGGLAGSPIDTTPVLVPVGETRRLSVTFTAAIATGGAIYVLRSSAEVASQAVVRKVMCSTTTDPYFDGNTPPFRYGPTAQIVTPKWSGTAGQSSSYFDYEEPWELGTQWDGAAARAFELGVDRGMFYPSTGAGVAWNGLINISEKPSSLTITPYYQDGTKYYNDASTPEFSASVEAYTYPDILQEYTGMLKVYNGLYSDEQPLRPFGLSYRTKIGDGVYGPDIFYKIHLVYNALAIPSSRSYGTVNENPEAASFSWDLQTLPAAFATYGPTSHLMIDSRKFAAGKLKNFETILYGTSTTSARLPLPAEVRTILA